MKRLKTLLTIILALTPFYFVHGQITAPDASSSFSTSYTSGYLNNGGENDIVYVFCSDQANSNVGELTVSAGACSVIWYEYDGFSYSTIGQTTNTATGLSSGLYMAQVDCSGSISCYRAWVWVNQTYVDIAPIDPGCENFTLTAEAGILDNTFTINDPPGLNFEIDENTFIKVCFWANHTYVSDLGFYLKAPGQQLTEPGNPGVVALLPAASDWGIDGTHQSNLTIPWTVTGCDPEDENTPCNSGNHLEEFCFSTNAFPGGPTITPADPTYVPCVCNMTIPLSGVYAPAEVWDNIYGYYAGDPGWAVQIYDCENVDFGALTMASLIFSAETECGQTTFVYDSGEIYSTINDNSCDATNASLYVVPPEEPAGEYTITSEITDYSWSCTGSGFNGDQLSHDIIVGTSDYPQETSDFILTVTETIIVAGSPECNVIDSETFLTLPSDATITPVEDVCTNSSPFQLEAVDGGGTWSTNAPSGSIVNNVFYPEIAGEGTWTITYEIDGPCIDIDQIDVTIYESIHVENFIDNVCDGTNTYYTVTFDVLNGLDNPTSFNVDFGTGQSTIVGSFSEDFPSQTSYSITITDEYGCNEYIYEGYQDCGCTTFSGTLNDNTPIHLCNGQCTDMLTHNNNEILDGDDMLEFAIHDGAYPATIYARNTTPEFCLSDIPGGVTEQFYYISAIAGNNAGGHVSQIDGCYSQSVSTPVVWHANPIAHIDESDISVCGLSVNLVATEPAAGQIGTWSANGVFTPTVGNIHTHEMSVIKNPPYGDLTFTWTVVNNNCNESDNVIVHFTEMPNAYAGEDITICGNEADLEAVLSLPGSNGQWSGNGSFTSQSSESTSVTSTDTQVFTWREINGTCYDEDNVTVVFIQEPQPTTTPNVDTVCGIVYNLNVFNVNGTGSWTAYHDGSIYSPAPYYEGGSDIPNPIVYVSYGTDLFIDIDFVWTETIQSNGIECTNTATKRVVFSRQPIASVGPYDQAEECGNCFTFSADTIGSGWATGYWIAKEIIGDWDGDNPGIPNASFCIDPLGSFGNTASVQVQFLWVMNNTGCTSIDTMNILFYKQPVANAGISDATCGNYYELGAIYDLTESGSYSPSGIWSVYQEPDPLASANIITANNDSTEVSVSHYGIWAFQFRENNSLLPSCHSTDTVSIEFVEKPVITAGEDKDVCGTCTDLEGISGGFSGSWLANGSIYTDFNDPQTHVCQNGYGDITYTWLESHEATTTTLSCSSQDEVIITYWRVPTANILTDLEDSTTCGLYYDRLRAENPGSEITGYWFTYNPGSDFGDEFDVFTDVTVPEYGYHEFYWIEETGPDLTPGFCNDTAGPLRIHFIEIPDANAGGDTLFCGYTGILDAFPSVGTGVWSTPSEENVSFEDINDPNTQITSAIINTGNPTNPYFELIWTEDNTNGCTDRDTIKVIFARIPESIMNIIPPKCFGEPATIATAEDSLQQYTWNFFSGTIDTTTTNPAGGEYENFVFWNSTDTLHRISLYATNHWGCQSPITIDTVYEPAIPDFDVTLVLDTCMLGKGGIIFGDTLSNNSFFWLDTTVGPAPGTPITSVYEIPIGEYYIRTSYLTPNTTHYAYYLTTFGTANCVDTLLYEIEPIGMIEAIIEISTATDMGELVAPEATVIFLNNSIYDNVGKRCEWHFGDETTEKNCDPQIEHIYTEAGCFEPFLIVMNRDLPECRDTAFLETCIPIDNASKIEVPNIFSPNSDGVNDFFQVKAQTLRTFSGIIINRWGRTVYEWENWQDYEAGWDGKLSGGTDAAVGVYFFVIKAVGMDNQEYEMQGPLHLMRE
jgi:gliding motility-associated-like protein